MCCPAVYGYFFIPNYPSDIATVNFDRSGTTVIGKYLLNHSFMMPGLICVITSTIVAYLLKRKSNFFALSNFSFPFSPQRGKKKEKIIPIILWKRMF